MEQDRIRWNRKYQDDKGMGEVSPLVAGYAALAPGKLALDVAAGTGRNALFLARQGFRVVAVDVADEAMRRLIRLEHSNIFPVQADLDTFPFRAERFDLIVCCLFLDRRLLPDLRESLSPGGVLLYESAMLTDLDMVDQPRNPDYLLRTNELLHVFLSMRIVRYEETLVRGSGGRKVLARLAAQNGRVGDRALAGLGEGGDAQPG